MLVCFATCFIPPFSFNKIPNPEGCQTYRVNSNIFMEKHKVKSRSGCGRSQAVDNAIHFCYSIGRERYLFELLSLTISIIMRIVCRQRLIKSENEINK